MDKFQSVLWFIAVICALIGALVFVIGVGTASLAIAIAVIPVCFAHAVSELTK